MDNTNPPEEQTTWLPRLKFMVENSIYTCKDLIEWTRKFLTDFIGDYFGDD